MPALKNETHERFAQLRAEGFNQSQSYERAGGTGDRSYSAKIDARPEVIGRIAELRAAAEADRLEREGKPASQMSGLDLLDKAADAAMKTKNPVTLAQVGKIKAEFDESVKSLAPDHSAYGPRELAEYFLPFHRSMLAEFIPLNKLPDDEAIKTAVLTVLGPDSFKTDLKPPKLPMFAERKTVATPT